MQKRGKPSASIEVQKAVVGWGGQRFKQPLECKFDRVRLVAACFGRCEAQLSKRVVDFILHAIDTLHCQGEK